jgi:hypothetical protein
MPEPRVPIHPAGAVFIFTHFIAARFQIDNLFYPASYFTAAVEIARNVGVDLDASGFGLRKTVDTFGRKRA